MNRLTLASKGCRFRLRDVGGGSTKSDSRVLADQEGATPWLTEQANPAGAKGISVTTSRGGGVRASYLSRPRMLSMSQLSLRTLTDQFSRMPNGLSRSGPVANGRL